MEVAGRSSQGRDQELLSELPRTSQVEMGGMGSHIVGHHQRGVTTREYAPDISALSR